MAYRDSASQALRRPNRQQHPALTAIMQAAQSHAQAQQARAGLRSALTSVVAHHLSQQLQPGGPMTGEPSPLGGALAAARSALPQGGQAMPTPEQSLALASAARSQLAGLFGGAPSPVSAIQAALPQAGPGAAGSQPTAALQSAASGLAGGVAPVVQRAAGLLATTPRIPPIQPVGAATRRAAYRRYPTPLARLRYQNF